MSDINFCPQCGTTITARDAYCGTCGQALPSAAISSDVKQAEPSIALEAAAAADNDESGFPIVGVVVSIVVVIVVGVNIRDWMGWGGEDEQEKPASTTFSEWSSQDIWRPPMPEKGGFTNIGEASDADSPESLEVLLGEMLMQEIENSERQTGGSPVAIPIDSDSLPPAAGSQLQATGPVPPAPGSQPPSTGSLPPASGSLPPSTGSLPPASGSLPPAAGFSPPGAGAVPTPPARGRIPYIEPGDQVFVSGVLQTTCDTGLEYITFELSVVSDGSTTGDLLSSGWMHVALQGWMTPAGELTVSGQSADGNALQVSGRLRYDDSTIFLKGGGQFHLGWNGDQGASQCSGQWLTEEL